VQEWSNVGCRASHDGRQPFAQKASNFPLLQGTAWDKQLPREVHTAIRGNYGGNFSEKINKSCDDAGYKAELKCTYPTRQNPLNSKVYKQNGRRTAVGFFCFWTNFGLFLRCSTMASQRTTPISLHSAFLCNFLGLITQELHNRISRRLAHQHQFLIPHFRINHSQHVIDRAAVRHAVGRGQASQVANLDRLSK
jgi:hypothetical protein